MRILVITVALFTSLNCFAWAWDPCEPVGQKNHCDEGCSSREIKFFTSTLETSTKTESANSSNIKNSEPFFMAITGRVCSVNGKCERYSGDSGNFTVNLTDGKGRLEFTYEIEGVKVTNTVSLSYRSEEIELYIELENDSTSLSKSSSSILVPSIEKFYWSNTSGVGFKIGDVTVYPEVVVGPAVL